MLQSLALIFALATIVEGLVEYFGSPIPSVYKRYAAAALGVGLCLAYGADLLAQLGYAAQVPAAGQVLTGVLIGRGSNYLNDLMSRLAVIRTPAATVAAIEAAAPPLGLPPGGRRSEAEWAALGRSDSAGITVVRATPLTGDQAATDPPAADG